MTPLDAVALVAVVGVLGYLFVAPAVDQPQTIHVILEVSDDGSPSLTSLRRAVVTIEPKDVVIQSRPSPCPVRLAFCKGPDGEVIEFFQNQST